MRKISTTFLSGLLVLGLAAPALAGNQADTFTLDPFTGFYQFDDSQRLDMRSYYGLRGGYNFTKNLALEGMAGYTLTEIESQAYEDRDVRLFRYGIDALYHFNADGTFVPFVSAGLGGTQTWNTMNGMNNNAYNLFNYGVGLKYFLADTVALRGDVKQAHILESGETKHNMEYTVGLTFLLGAKEKEVAAVRAAAPVADTTPPAVICTSPDSDVSGVAVDRNVGATFSEEVDSSTASASTFTVKRGNTPIKGKATFGGTTATFNPDNGFEPGVTYTATVAAGVKDKAGNPLAKDEVWKFTTVPAPKIVPPVMITLGDNHFLYDSAEITENGKTILNYNARILKANPKTKIRIAGYTSASGSNEYNQKLSEERATAVKEYLVKEGGIDRDRLTKIGYGENRPAEYEAVPENIYSEEAKKNQRVLFEIIVK